MHLRHSSMGNCRAPIEELNFVKIKLPVQLGGGFSTLHYDIFTTVFVLKATVLEKIRNLWNRGGGSILPLESFDLCLEASGLGRLHDTALVSRSFAEVNEVSPRTINKAEEKGEGRILYLLPCGARVREAQTVLGGRSLPLKLVTRTVAARVFSEEEASRETRRILREMYETELVLVSDLNSFRSYTEALLLVSPTHLKEQLQAFSAVLTALIKTHTQLMLNLKVASVSASHAESLTLALEPLLAMYKVYFVCADLGLPLVQDVAAFQEREAVEEHDTSKAYFSHPASSSLGRTLRSLLLRPAQYLHYLQHLQAVRPPPPPKKAKPSPSPPTPVAAAALAPDPSSLPNNSNLPSSFPPPLKSSLLARNDSEARRALSSRARLLRVIRLFAQLSAALLFEVRPPLRRAV